MEGSTFSGVDSCDLGLMCLGGSCVPLCEPDMPQCSAARPTCVTLTGGQASVCTTPCDPLAPACPEQEGCYLFGDGVFACAVPPLDALTEAGRCSHSTDCVPESVAGHHVPTCDGSWCCTPVCDAQAEAPQCPAGELGQRCEPIPGAGGSVGVCVVP